MYLNTEKILISHSFIPNIMLRYKRQKVLGYMGVIKTP